MKLYLAGPMQGYPEHNFPAFKEAREKLREAGYEVVCPAELGRVDGFTWSQYLRRDIKHLMDCDAIATLPGWTLSPGAKLETKTGAALGMEIQSVDMWLTAAE